MKRISLLLLAIILFSLTPAHAAILVFSSNGTSTPKLTLEAARTAAGSAGKTVVVTSALSQSQSNISGAWPADRMLKVEKGGSIANSTAFAINGPFNAGLYQVFAGTGTVTFGAGSVSEVPPEWWGAKADGTTVSRTACAAAAATGIDVKFQPGTYFMGNIAPVGTLNQEYIMQVSGKSGQRFIGNNTTLTLNLTNAAAIAMWSVVNSNNISWEGFKIIGTGSDPFTGTEHGVVGIVLIGTSDIYSLSAKNMYMENGLDFFQSQTSYGKARMINFNNIYVKNCCYGLICIDSGDQLTVRNFTADGVKRAYFVSGVNHHDVDVRIINNKATSGVCMIKAYNHNTSDIRLRARFESGLNGTIVGLEHQPDVAGTSILSDIDIDLAVADDTYIYDRVTFRSYTALGVLETTTNNKWLRIAIRGYMGAGVPVGEEMIRVSSRPANFSTLTLSPEVLRIMSTIRPSLNGFILEQPEGDIVTVFGSTGDAVDNLAINVPMGLEGYGGYFRLRYTAVAVAAGLAGQLSTSAEYVFFAFQASGGALVVGTPTKIWEVKTSTNPAVISLSSDGGSGLVVSFTDVGTEYATTGTPYVRLEISRLTWIGR